MRLRQFHKLFLTIAVTALVAAVAMAGVLSLSLGRGFADYLVARDDEELDDFVAAAAAFIETRGGVAALRDGRLTLPAMLDEMGRPSDVPRAPPPMPFPPAGHPPGDNSAGHRDGPPGRRRPPENFAARLLIFDASGRQVAGPPPPRGRVRNVSERVIRIGTSSVATVRLLPRGPAPIGVDQRFLQRQYVNATILVLLLLALAGLPAWWLARRGATRVADMNRVTNAIAHGNFAPRLAVQGHDELAEMGQHINAMAESLAQLDGARRRWLAQISHELRTPLTALVGELDALRDGIRPLSPVAIESLSEDAQRLSRIVQDLHFLAVSDLSGPTCLFQPTDALEVIRHVVNRFAPALHAAGLHLVTDFDGLTTLPVVWDADRIEQLLTNLLSNSGRYTNAPGRVQLRVTRTANQVRIIVVDSAPSVPAEHQHRLFEPLYRTDAARSRATGGSGLGLAVCDAIVRAHGGQITAAPAELGGLLVQVDLPIEGHPT
jgi:two-component system sensor histidine kinase BaeS